MAQHLPCIAAQLHLQLPWVFPSLKRKVKTIPGAVHWMIFRGLQRSLPATNTHIISILKTTPTDMDLAAANRDKKIFPESGNGGNKIWKGFYFDISSDLETMNIFIISTQQSIELGTVIIQRWRNNEHWKWMNKIFYSRPLEETYLNCTLMGMVPLPTNPN